MWVDAQKHLASAPGKQGDHVRAYLSALEQGNATAAQSRKAFDLVAARFRENVTGSGKTFQGYDFERIHHRNWPIGNHPGSALNPRQLFPVSHAKHMEIHRAVTSGPHPTSSPIAPQHALEFSQSTPLPSGYFGGK